ncbi:type II toxin-antitoxin system VapC family toxin [Sinimarinibacterium sp. NLF-5-8]|uniref:type II toxin-antitoxin system VapC family toxin n=1 Tax=Sinimarinibacterium sp. NLF-5-8 TaxID=2698684 RepID=UPI00137BA230|nr:type II toxin-antitoxin system VapC family toxin [Sinimarinibacterium sp. NLF-5-8]QHS11342.1 type II toxin-antitoxin system VapC family toxin [Sinimarinibacterium sp. NLF-5-8]
MNIIADTNIFLAVVLNGPAKAGIVKATAGVSIVAPEILPYEIGNALSAMVKRRALQITNALAAEKATKRIAARLIPVNISAALQIALDHDIYAYDAYFLQCAQRLNIPLLTLDKRMKQVAQTCGIPTIEIEP